MPGDSNSTIDAGPPPPPLPPPAQPLLLPPTPTQWALFVALAFVATFGHLMIVRAYDHAEASLLAPLAYTEMVTSVILGWIFFKDFPDFWTFIGVGILISCAIYISMRERAAGKPAAPDAVQQP